jgi:hypothetical protein
LDNEVVSTGDRAVYVLILAYFSSVLANINNFTVFLNILKYDMSLEAVTVQ